MKKIFYPEENRNLIKSAWIVGISTGLSRIFGYIRDMIVARYFGSSYINDAFIAAFRIPNILRRLLAEGSLTVSFIPVFTEYLKTKSQKDAFKLANVVFTLLSIVLVFIIIIGIIISPYMVSLMTPGFVKNPDKYKLTVFLTRIMFPYIFFISLVALCMGILNSMKIFAIPALSPVLLNISMIIATLFLKNFFQEPIISLAIGVIIGGLLQLFLQIPVLLKIGLIPRLDFNFSHPGVKKIKKLMLPAIFGAAIYQINVFIGTLLASFLPNGSLSYLYFADRVVELPLGLFAIALGTASLPSLSEFAAQGKIKQLKNTIAFSIKIILLTAIPSSIILIQLREPIISVLFQRGQFDLTSTVLSAQALLCYSLGLWAFSLIRIIISAFYALQDTLTPVKIGIYSLILNTILSLILMFPLQHSGLALANSLASIFNVGILSIILKKKIGNFLTKDIYNILYKILLSSLLMWISLYILKIFYPWNNLASLKNRFLYLLLLLFISCILYLISSIIFQIKEIFFLLNFFIKKIK